MTAAEIRTAGEALARRTRKAQGLPKTIHDPEAIRRIVALLVSPIGDIRNEAQARGAA
jgi:hypothetical protein